MKLAHKNFSKIFVQWIKAQVKKNPKLTDYIIKLISIKNKTKNEIMYFLAQFNYRKCLFQKNVYFGSYMAAKQGDSVRHYFMQKIVESECKRHRTELKVLEVGSWAGGSAITWAEAIKKYNLNINKGEVYCIDSWIDYRNTTKPMSEALRKNKIFDLFQHNINASGYSNMIFVFRGFSGNILPMLKNNQFDLIFIDGDHSYKAVLQDVQNAVPLLKEGGILCGDDLELQYFEIDIENGEKNKEQDFIIDTKTQNYFHPGVCLAIGEFFGKEVSEWHGFWAMRKKENKWEKIELDADIKSIEIPQHLK